MSHVFNESLTINEAKFVRTKFFFKHICKLIFDTEQS